MTTAASDPPDAQTARAESAAGQGAEPAIGDATLEQAAQGRTGRRGKKAAPAARGPVGESVELVKTVLYALAIALVLRVVLFQPFTIPSASMEPTLFEGDYIIVSKFAYGWSRYSIPFSPPIGDGRLLGRAPHRGDIIVFKLPREPNVDYIKRLVGVPGDRIQVRAGAVYINGAPIKRTFAGTGPATCPMSPTPLSDVRRYRETLASGKSYVTDDCIPDVGDADNTATYVVPQNCYFMMGDNRDNSLDSRFPPDAPGSAAEAKCGWNHPGDAKIGFDPSTEEMADKQRFGVGFVPAENLVGRADLILLSWHPGASLFKPWTWVLKARPSRFLHWLG